LDRRAAEGALAAWQRMRWLLAQTLLRRNWRRLLAQRWPRAEQ
jgi:hypothetical protein